MTPPERSDRVDVDRPQRLRRAADSVEAQAPRSADPAAAVAIAREMRIRAARLEADDDDDFEEAQRLIKTLDLE